MGEVSPSIDGLSLFQHGSGLKRNTSGKTVKKGVLHRGRNYPGKKNISLEEVEDLLGRGRKVPLRTRKISCYHDELERLVREHVLRILQTN